MSSALANNLQKQREAAQAAVAAKKAEAAKKTAEVVNASSKFEASATLATQKANSAAIVGLFSIEEWRKAQQEADAREAAALLAGEGGADASACKPGAAPRAGEKRARALLSFADDEEEDADGGVGLRLPVGRGRAPPATTTAAAPPATQAQENDTAAPPEAAASTAAEPDAKRPRLMKDPTVATDFLPDKERAAREAALRLQLKAEWQAAQEAIKGELIEVVYSWWDGTGHRRSIVVPKGTTISRFLERVRQELAGRDVPSLAGVSSDALLYVKEDSIIPHNLSFYDLIVTQARGKSGPLFRFDLHQELSIASDARVAQDASHPGKVVERRWYERNKHIFPASHWELYEPGLRPVQLSKPANS